MFPILWFLFGLPVLIGTYAALYLVLTRHGNSGLWTVVPLALVSALAFLAVRRPPSSDGLQETTFGYVISAIWLACFLGWFILIGAVFVNWSEKRQFRSGATKRT